MPPIVWLTPLLAPLALGLVAWFAARRPGPNPTAVIHASRIASVVAVGAAVATALLVVIGGGRSAPLPVVGDLGFVVRLDALSAVMLALVAFMGAVLLRFSSTYLDGDARHGVFLGRFALTVASVMMLVLSGHLVHLAVFWAATSFALHRLLLFYPDRRAAVVAARKKWIVARLGDGLLIAAAVVLYGAFGTGDLASILEMASGFAAAGALPAGVGLAAFLVAASAALKSAQFPTHGWLIEVMETPTPVSALLHAGIINGGTFLIVRLGEVVLLSPATLGFLIVVGGWTALFGSIVLVTQNSVKVSLAYSSAAHMGFMLLLCGLGAFPVAILHLVAHSFYKAHAFLSSGSAVESARAAPAAVPRPVTTASVLAGVALSLATVLGIAGLLGISVFHEPVTVGLAGILAVSLTQLWSRGVEDRGSWPVLGRTLMAAAGTTLAFFTLEAGAAALLSDAVARPEGTSVAQRVLMSLIVGAFALTIVAQLRLSALVHTPRWAALYVHLRNGLYANALFDRLVGAYAPAPSNFLPTESL